MRRNNIKLLERRKAINKDSLIIGIDIGSEFNAVAFQNKIGEILDIIPIQYNSRKGFDYLDNKICDLISKYNFTDVHIGFEPTGIYWKNIIYYLADKGYLIHFIRTTAVKNQRELDESSSSKTDIKDANLIASLVREGKYIDAKIQHGVYRNLRDLGKLRARVMKMKTSMICRLNMLVKQYFPELINCFWSLNSRSLWKLLKKYPFPNDINNLSDFELIKLLKTSGMKESKLIKQEKEIKNVAKISIGLTTNDYDRFNITNCIEQLEMYHKQLKDIKKKMKVLLEDTEYWQYIKTIKGLGIVTAATLLGELGDPNNFKNAKEIIKFSGLDPREKSSGLYKGKVKISKKGRYLMRTIIYFICLRLIYRDKSFRDYYLHKLSTLNSRGRLLEKREALMAVGIKFIKVLFAMIRDRKEYNQLQIGQKKIA